MELYLPEEWAEDERRRATCSIPEDLRFRKKWEIALEQIDQALASGLMITCVVTDAGYGNTAKFREGLEKRGLKFAVAIKTTDKAFEQPPDFIVPEQDGGSRGRPRTRGFVAADEPEPKAVAEIAKQVADDEWTRVVWRKGSKGKLQSDFVALRVTPSKLWRKGQQHNECWLLIERSIGEKQATRFYFSNLPESTSLKQLVALARTRWPIEQSYEQLKDELALDHFEGRSYPGFHHHLVLTAMAFTFLQLERRRSRAEQLPTLNALRQSVTELVTAQLFASNERFSHLITEFARDPPDC
jgi:SRSO17 transposase